jgi:hypothetical protein
MSEFEKNDNSVKVIDIKYGKDILTSAIVFIASLFILYILKGEGYFLGGFFLGVIYFSSFLFSKNLDTIKIQGSSIKFMYYAWGFIRKEIEYSVEDLFIEVKRIVAFKGGVDYNMKFYTKANVKIFEISIRDFKEKEDFNFLDNLLSKNR